VTLRNAWKKSALSLALLPIALVACGHRPTNEQRFEVAFQVRTDDGNALAGATFHTENQTLGTTGDSGSLNVRLKGAEGQIMPIALSCPKEYASPEVLPALRLTHSRPVQSAATQPISYEATCTRKMREVVLVVRANNGADIPVEITGKLASATDADGNAHVLLRVNRDVSSLAVSLDTSAQPKLKPQSPSRVFKLSGKDSVLFYEQSFATSIPKAQAHKSSRAPHRHVPYRVN
jgi:hypothetical protein